MKIRPATDADRYAIWNIFHEVVAAGDTYALDPNISREDALALLVCARYAHLRGGDATSRVPNRSSRWDLYLRPNQSGGGSHVANAGFMVSASARGQGMVAQWPSIA